MDNLNIDEDKKIILQKFRNMNSDILEPHHDDILLLRFLKARDFDVQKARKMMSEDFKFRKKLGSDHILEGYRIPEEIEPYVPSTVLGFSYTGNIVRQVNVGMIDMKGFLKSMSVFELLKMLTFIFESDLDMMRKHNANIGSSTDTTIYIVDYQQLRVHQWCDRTVIRAGLQLVSFYQDHYPETMYQYFGINVPNYITYLYNAVFLPFVAEAVRKKIKFFGVGDDSYKEELFSVVPKEIVPAYLGGERYEPEGDPMCHGVLRWKSKIPSSFYRSNEMYFDDKDPEMEQKLIRERSVFEIEKNVETPNTILSWQFQTKERNIKFGLFFRKNISTTIINHRNRDVREVILPVENTDSNLVAEKGEYVCEKCGTYILQFDNTYSWLRSKLLYYKVEIQEPQEISEINGYNQFK